MMISWVADFGECLGHSWVSSDRMVHDLELHKHIFQLVFLISSHGINDDSYYSSCCGDCGGIHVACWCSLIISYMFWWSTLIMVCVIEDFIGLLLFFVLCNIFDGVACCRWSWQIIWWCCMFEDLIWAHAMSLPTLYWSSYGFMYRVV